MVNESILNLFRDCTVRIKTPQNIGTGFFVAPGHILTCNHVVKSAKDDEIEVIWKEVAIDIEDVIQSEGENPDLAILKTAHVEHPCVYLDKESQPNDLLYSYGYPPKYEGGFSVNPLCVGPTDRGRLITIRDENIQPGLSGAPLLNLRTWKVCGLIKSERNIAPAQNILRALGGQAIPTQVIFDWCHEIEIKHSNFHFQDTRWRELILDLIKELRLEPKEQKATIDIFYQELEELLKLERWKEADQLTADLMLRLSNCSKNYLEVETVQNLSSKDLQRIDFLWREFSSNHFGFSIQKHRLHEKWSLWESDAGTNENALWMICGKLLGWHREGLWFGPLAWKTRSELTFTKEAPKGHLPASWVFGWGGIWSKEVFIALFFRRDL
jgi:hypothetical protein